MSTPMQKTKLASLMLICFLISGCSASDVKEKLQDLDQKAGEFMENFQDNKIKDIFNNKQESAEPESTDDSSKEIDIQNLTEAQKMKVDNWLKEHELNRYGDPEGTFYAGGTPLFDEITGLSVERYYYILKNHPEIVEFLEAE